MRRFFILMISVVPIVSGALAQTGSRVAVAANGWNVSADREQAVLNIAHDGLGALMNDIRLNLREGRSLHLLSKWSVERSGAQQLILKTVQPPSAWVFDLGPNLLKISSTSSIAVITARAPASKDRVVARVMDPQGVPVEWLGTNEVVSSYGGSQTRNGSFLPRQNPEVMYFGLGPVSGSAFHSLFDRKTDTAICFSDQTLLRRQPDQDLLDLTMPVPGNALIRLVPNYYTKTLGVPFYVPFNDTYFGTAPMVWSSWTSYYQRVTENDIVRNADWLADHLKPYGFQYVELDDGYDRGKKGEHYWIENWDLASFPHGPQWLANYIKSKGLRAGLWLVPNAYAGAVQQHPDWYLRDKEGNLIPDYSTPALDSTNPEVLSFLRHLFTTLNGWGFEYYKFDGEHALPAYAPRVDRSRLYDRSADPVVAYRDRLRMIRETIGPTTFVEGCPAGTPLNGIGYFNSYFNGADVYNTWQGMYALFSSINANAFLNHIVVYLMPGEGVELSPPMSVEEAKRNRIPVVVERVSRNDGPTASLGATLAEARTLVTYVALTGVAYPLVSVMPELPAERIRLLKMTLPTMPIVPIDLFSRGSDARYGLRHTQPDYYIHNYPEILDLKVNAKSGVYDVAALTNWRSQRTTGELSFAEKLGLDAGSSWVVFDYWNQKLLGVFKDRMTIEIEPHDTRVLLVYRLLNRPQLIGLSRHITGAYSIRGLSWDAAKNTLRGSSETVPGEPYIVWVYVPDGVAVGRVHAWTSGNRDVAVNQALTGNALMVSFLGQQEGVEWELTFAGKARR